MLKFDDYILYDNLYLYIISCSKTAFTESIMFYCYQTLLKFKKINNYFTVQCHVMKMLTCEGVVHT